MAKYYWLKLHKDFFKQHEIVVVEEMPNGKDYILFYLKLLVESVSHDGLLRFSDTIPYNEQMLASITHTNIDIVRSAMQIFKELKMIEVLDDATIFMTEVNKMIGCESEWAEKKRIYRENHPKKNNELGQCTDNVRQEIRDKSIDNSNTNVLLVEQSSEKEQKKSDFVKKVVDYLNKKSGKNFKTSSSKTVSCINARINDGFTLEDFYKVIDNKVGEWSHDSKMSKYIRPETLFGTKFESYLNQESTKLDDGFDYQLAFKQFADAYPKPGGYNIGLNAFIDMMKGVENPKFASKELFGGMKLYIDDCKKRNPNNPTQFVKSIDKWFLEDSMGWVEEYRKRTRND